MEIPEGPVCQSCSMPLDSDEKYGTEADGGKSGDYCRFCYLNGEFTEPEMTIDKMIDLVVSFASEKMDMSPDEARAVVSEFIPKLKRWRG